MGHLLRIEPVRIYSIAVAALAIVAFYFPALPVALIVALIAAILGVGEGVRHMVAPMEKVVVHEDDGVTLQWHGSDSATVSREGWELR